MAYTSVMRVLSLSLLLTAQLQAFSFEAKGSDVSHGIVGGEVITDTSRFEYKHTVRLLNSAVTEGENLPDSLRGIRLSWRCSAVIINKNTIISAAHCFPKIIGLKDPKSDGVYRAQLKDLKVEAFFKTDPRADRMSGIRAHKILVHPGFRDDWTSKVGDVWNPAEAINDLALVRLQESIPADKAAVELPLAGDEELREGETLVLAGYGRDLSDEQISLPRLRSVQVPLRELLRNKTEWYAGHGDINRAGRVDRPAGGCMGDSGGPAFVQRSNKAKLVGVIVRGPDEVNGGCAAAVTILTALPAFSKWISESLKELN
jgi:secreted trypsin-like serine protease